jgi:small subunit ribosomal protein S17
MSETENEETTTEETPAAEVEETPAAEVEETPAAEEAPAAETTPAEDPAAPAPQSGPKPKRKRLPRSERPKKTRPKREPSTGRKPITRLPKEEGERGRRQERRGVVVSDAMDKTIVVKVEAIRSHPKYKKVIRRSVKFHAHDEQNAAHVGDVVRIVETRPLSKTKNWRLAEIVEVAK